LGKAWELRRHIFQDERAGDNEEAAVESDFLGMVEAGPQSVEEAIQSPEKDLWMRAVDEEIQNLERLKTWVVVENIPEGRKAITLRLVLQRNLDSGGDHKRYKARLVAHGYKQKPGIDFLHTYAPLISLSTVRLVLSFAATHNYEIHQLDIVAAFLESEIKEEIYLQLPFGFGIVGGTIQDASLCRVAYTGKREPVCVRILKSLYGLRQSALNWYGKLDSELIRNRFRKSDWEAGVYYQGELVLLVWVDDILLVGGRSAVQATRKILENTFTIRDMGPIAHFLGMRVTRDLRTKVISLDQSGYISQVLRRFQMDRGSGVSAPLDPGMSLLKRNGRMTTVVEEEGAMRKEGNLLRDDQIEEQVDQKEYQEIVGSLNYAAIATRPDISFAVGVLGRYASDPARRHMIMAK